MVLWLGTGAAVAVLASFMGQTLRTCASGTPPSPTAVLWEGLLVLGRAGAPVLLAAAVVAAFVGFAQVGALFTLEPLAFKLDRLNPGRGLKQMFSKKNLFELGKGLLKSVAVAWIAWSVLSKHVVAIARAGVGGAEETLRVGGTVGKELFFKTVLVFGVLAAADYFFQRRSWLKEQRMTKYEVKQELKQSEGDPHHKAERQRLHQEILQHNMLQQVRKADCVIVNPVHIAVALKYDKETMAAPQVVAKGERLLAEQIQAIARECGIPIFRNVPLAHSLVRLDLGEEIPEELYEAVAEVLRLVYKQSAEGTEQGGAGRQASAPQTQHSGKPVGGGPLGGKGAQGKRGEED